MQRSSRPWTGIYWIEPPGFAHPVDLNEDLAVDETPDFTRTTQAKLNAPFNETDASGQTSSHGDRGFTVWTKKEELFLTTAVQKIQTIEVSSFALTAVGLNRRVGMTRRRI